MQALMASSLTYSATNTTVDPAAINFEIVSWASLRGAAPPVSL